MEAAAAAMDFHALSRRELQALCKRNGVRANMTNAAMAEALQGLASVDGIGEIGTTLCLPTPGRSAMKSAAKMAELAGEEQQQGSPLPRGRRVSVKSPEAIRMEVEEREDETKRDLVKEIVRTPGVALRSTSRRPRATPAPLPTPVPASSARATTRRTAARKAEEVAPTPTTLRRSQRTAGRKAAAPVEVEEPAEDVSEAKKETGPARSKMTMALYQEEEVQQEEPKAVAPDMKCDEPDEEEVTKLLGGDSKEVEPEEGDEADSSDVAIGSAVVTETSCDDTKMEEVVVVVEEEATKPQEEIVEEKEPASVEKPAPLATMEEDSPILGVLCKAEASEPVTVEDASLEDDVGRAEWSPMPEMTDEPIKEDGCTETDRSPEEILPTAVEGETSEEGDLTQVKEGAADEMPQAGLEDYETSEEDDLAEMKEEDAAKMKQTELSDDETSEEDEEDELAELKEGAAAKTLGAELSDDETSEEDEESPSNAAAAAKIQQAELSDDEISEEDEEDDLTELKEGVAAKKPQAELSDGETSEEDEEGASDDAEASEEIESIDDSDEEADETDDESNTTDVVQMLQGTMIAEEANEDASTEDDFSSDLPPEFDNVAVFSDSETESNIAPLVLEENQDVVASATKSAVKSLDDSAITEEQQVSEADATEKAMKEVDSIVKCLDEFTIKGEAKEEVQKLPRVEDYENMSLRKLRSSYKECLVASKQAGKETTEGKRLPLEEVDENACSDC